MTLDYFRVQQQKVAAFASGMHSRLGAASGVSWLDEQALMMIADEVLGGWACSSLGVAARARCSQSVM